MSEMKRANPHGWQTVCLCCGCPATGDKRCTFNCVCHDARLQDESVAPAGGTPACSPQESTCSGVESAGEGALPYQETMKRMITESEGKQCMQRPRDPGKDALRDARLRDAGEYLKRIKDLPGRNELDSLHWGDLHSDHYFTLRDLLEAFARSRTVSLEAQLRDPRGLLCDLLAAEARNAKLVGALTRYGQHFPGCKYGADNKFFDKDCSCGFRKALNGEE